jgi:hypothetical protein
MRVRPHARRACTPVPAAVDLIPTKTQVETTQEESSHKKLDVDSIWNRQLRHLLVGGDTGESSADLLGGPSGRALVNVSSDDHIGAVSFQAIEAREQSSLWSVRGGDFDRSLAHIIGIPSPTPAQVAAARVSVRACVRACVHVRACACGLRACGKAY